MLNLLWDQLKSKLHPSELSEASFILGEDRIERNSEVSSEIISLLDLFEEIPSRFQDLSTHKHKVEFYLSKLSTKAKQLGVEPSDLISLKTPRDKIIFEFLSDGGSTRPQTAESNYIFSENLPLNIDFYFIEEHKFELIKGLDSEYKFLKEKVEAIQKDLISQACVPSPNEVTEFSKRLEVRDK